MQTPILEGRNFSLDYAADRAEHHTIIDSLQKKKGKVSQDEHLRIVSMRSMIITKKTDNRQQFAIHLQFQLDVIN